MSLAHKAQTGAIHFQGDLSRSSGGHAWLLSDAQLAALFDERQTPDAGRQRIKHIRQSLPGRVTQTSKFAGKLRYPSQKMGFALEAEAFETEFVGIVDWEFDSNCLEMYTQPDHRLKISYKGRSGRRHTTLIRPDAFRVTKEAFVFTECKMESELERLGREQPERFVKDRDGKWRSPPAEEAASKIGCQFEIRSSAQNNFVLHDNLILLHDYFTKPVPEVPDSVLAAIDARMKGRSFISAFDLIHVEPRISADDLYILTLKGKVYFPMQELRLADQETALFFRSHDEWRAHAIFVQVDDPLRRRSCQRPQYRSGDVFTWNSVVYQVVNPGKKSVSCRSGDANASMINLTYGELTSLETSGQVVFENSEDAEVGKTVAEDLVSKASAEDLEEASWRYQILFGEIDRANPLSDRSERARAYWRRDFKEAEELYGNGFVGLLPERHGNRQDKAAPETKALARQLIKDEYETNRRKCALHVYGEYRLMAMAKGLEPVSYVSFCRYVKERSGHEQQVARDGEKAAYDLAPQYLELERTTPRHGQHSWQIGHIDHTPLPLKFLHSKFSEFADTVWLTILHGAFDRKVRGYYLSFDEPSYRSCMMVVRDCVRRHGRLFQFIVADGGSEFQSVYWETLLARLKVIKRERLKGKPKHGATCERIFGTSQTQFVTNLLGSTDIVEKYFRAISPEVEPKRHAVWILEKFDKGLDRYFDEVYHSNDLAPVIPDAAYSQCSAGCSG